MTLPAGRVRAASVIVPVRNGADNLPQLLDALAAQRDAPAFEVLVVDNGSTDATPAVVRDHPLGATLLHEPKPGSYAARNAAVAVARGEVLAFTDADCVPDPGWLAAGVAALGSADLAGGRVEVIVGAQPNVWERLDAGHYLDQRVNVELHRFAATANAFVRRSVFDDIGMFRAELRSGGDLDFCRRAVAGGHRLVLAPDALVRHHPRTSFRETWKLNRRLGAGLRDLHKLGYRPAWYRDQQMVLSPRWARGTSSTPDVRTSAPAAIAAWLTVIGGRWAGRISGR